MLVWNRVRVSGSEPYTPTQLFWEYLPPPPPPSPRWPPCIGSLKVQQQHCTMLFILCEVSLIELECQMVLFLFLFKRLTSPSIQRIQVSLLATVNHKWYFILGYVTHLTPFLRKSEFSNQISLENFWKVSSSANNHNFIVFLSQNENTLEYVAPPLTDKVHLFSFSVCQMFKRQVKKKKTYEKIWSWFKICRTSIAALVSTASPFSSSSLQGLSQPLVVVI